MSNLYNLPKKILDIKLLTDDPIYKNKPVQQPEPYTTEELIRGGFHNQQIVVPDMAGCNVIKVLTELVVPNLNVFFFKKVCDIHEIYKDFNKIPTIDMLKKELFLKHIDQNIFYASELPSDVDEIGIAIFPMRIWQSSSILSDDFGVTSDLFNCIRENKVKNILNFTKVVSAGSSNGGGKLKKKRTYTFRKSIAKKKFFRKRISKKYTFRKRIAK